MLEATGGSLVLVGAPGEKPMLQRMKAEIGSAVRLYTGKSMRQLVALIDAADVVVSNDTGPMHFAYLRKKPTVAAFKTMSPLCWGPPYLDDRFVALDYTMATDLPRAVDQCVPEMQDAVVRLAKTYGTRHEGVP